MKTLSINAVKFAKANIENVIPVQAFFNAFIENINSSELVVCEYMDSLSEEGKKLFTHMFSLDKEEIKEVSHKVKSRSTKLRKQQSVVGKTRKTAKNKVARATKALFSVNHFKIMEERSATLLRSIGIAPTETPTLELMALPLEEASFLFKTECQMEVLHCVTRLASRLMQAKAV